MNDDPNVERPQPEREALIIEKRSAGHAAVQLVESIAGDAQHTLVALAVTGAAMKVKGALGSKGDDSKGDDSKG